MTQILTSIYYSIILTNNAKNALQKAINIYKNNTNTKNT